MNVVYRLIAVLLLARRIGDLLTQAKAIVAAVTSNPGLFPMPTPSLTMLDTLIQDVDTKHTAAKCRTIGTAAARNVKVRELRSGLRLLLAYVQWVADQSPDKAKAIIEAALMSVKVVPVPSKAELTVKLAGYPGAVELFAKAGPKSKKSFFEWQINVDGKTWSALPSTVNARTRVDNLTPATMVSVRFRRNDAKGAKAWSQPVTILVH